LSLGFDAACSKTVGAVEFDRVRVNVGLAADTVRLKVELDRQQPLHHRHRRRNANRLPRFVQRRPARPGRGPVAGADPPGSELVKH
jgi:hypothetical protein